MPLLLCETMPTRIQHEGKKTYLEGIFLQSNVVNNNKRFYPREVLQHVVDSLQPKIRNGELYGELSHSDKASVDLTRVSHVVESLRRKGDDWYGRACVVNEGAGKILKAVIDAGGRVGASSKGFGSVKKVGHSHHVVQEDYQLVSIDAVANPSAQNAWIKAITESVLNENFSVNESALALKILKETAALASTQRPDGSSPAMKKYDQDEVSKSLFAGHAGFPSIQDARTALERCDDLTAQILAALLNLQDEIPIDDEGLEPVSVEKYIDSIRDPLERARAKRELWTAKRNEVMRARAMDSLSRFARMYGPR